MSKTTKERAGSRQAGDESVLIPPKYQHAAAIALLFLSTIFFFHAIVFGGKAFLDVDNIASHSFDTFLADATAQSVFPLWNPYIFCGMPAYGSLSVTGERLFDVTALLLGKLSDLFSLLILNPPSGWVFFFYFVFAAGMYLLAYSKVKNKFAAFVAAFAATFSMYIIIWVMVGHNTKIAVVAFLPFVFLLIEMLRERFSIPLALLLVLCLHFSFLPSHVQMIFYMYLAVGMYLAFLLIRSFFKKKEAETESTSRPEWKGILRAGITFALASVLAFAMDADRYLSVWEYNPYSMRGSNPIVADAQQTEAKTVEGGLDYDYATSWSFAPSEMMTWIIPSWYGFGLQDYQGMFTNNQPRKINTYWGPEPFTHAPQYMGLLVLLLAVFGFMMNRKDAFVQYLALMIFFSLLIAFGREFPLVYDLMYRYFPMFNKFRIPSMILVLVQMFIPILAAYGIVSVWKLREGLNFAGLQKRKKQVMFLLGGVCAVLFLLQAVYESFLPQEAIQYLFGALFGYQLPKDRVVAEVYRQIPPNVVSELTKLVSGFVTTDAFVAIGLLVVTGGALYLFMQNRVKGSTFSIVLVLAIGFDLWRVAYKPMDEQDRRMQQQVFAAPDYVRYLQADSSLFRILEFKDGQPPYNNMYAYWRIQNAFGYQGAKMRAYQDMVDVAGLNNPLVWGLMNVKYILNNQADSSAAVGLVYNGTGMKVYSNLSALPRAFFVNRYEVADGLATLNKIAAQSFDPRDVAYLMEDPNVQLEPVHPAAKAEFTRYGIQDFELKTTTSGTNLLFLSETYYPVGWKAFIDGEEVPILRVNYLFRAVVVKGGIHRLEMRFEPRGFTMGKNLSLFANLLTVGGLAYSGIDYWRKRKRG
ncbi:MAG TPA: hypothetical protein DCP63_04355 [Bacteroidetes bacterium]|nr:hypothetical protein [Bacteroidota bacterium]